jgi:predicted DNA-binding transcriptional regulator AlpA
MEYLTAKQVSNVTGYKYRHLWSYIKRGSFPQPDINIGNKPLWKEQTIAGLEFAPKRKKEIND